MSDMVLAIDDQEEFLNVVVKQIEQLGMKAISATNAKDGLSSFRQFRPFLVISDCHMPGLAATEEMVRTIRSESPGTLIIMMSGSPHLSLEWAKALGADFFIEKPFRTQTIETAIASAQRLKEIERS